VFAALVEKERSLISTRTRQALAAATEVTAGVFAFPADSRGGPKVLTGDGLLMSALKPIVLQNSH
jgi:hypothetical protein